MTCITFQNFTPSSDLLNSFYNDCKFKELANIIKQYKLKLGFNKCHIENVYLVMVSCHNDNVLIKLAKQCSFPRGFPIIWIPDIKIQYFGFYPKFSNDDRRANVYKNFKDVSTIKFFKKWSGFLGNLITFTHNGNSYWTATSKNSANNDTQFVKDSIRLFEPFITEQVLDVLVKNNYHISAEMMSKNDQTHGAQVYKETPIITAIGQGCVFDLQNNTILQNQKHFVNFMSPEEIVQFCVQYNLPCDSSVTINNVEKFLTLLNEQRDFLTNEKFDQLVVASNATIIKGTIDHKDILGDCLEGLVMKTDTNETIKYKFANYVIRTMLLRTYFNNFSFTSSLKTFANKFVEHWCVSENGKKYWKNYALACFIKYNEIGPQNSIIGDHILISDELNENDLNYFNNIEQKFDEMITDKSCTLIVFVGPIGCGKSTMSKTLNIPNSVVIDGDDLDLGTDIVLKLGKERNDYTRWKIIETLMKGKIPIISTGGGVLFSNAGKLAICDIISKVLKLNCNIITFIPENDDIDRLYDDNERVEQCIKDRVSRGEWKIDPKFSNINSFVKFICSLSRKNKQFAKTLVNVSSQVHQYPIIDKNNFDKVNLDVMLDVQNTPPSNGIFSQIRFLTMVDNKCGHITVSFDGKGQTEYSLDDFAQLNKFYERIINGTFYKVISGKNIYTFACPDKAFHKSGLTHITLDCGFHNPVDTGKIIEALKNNKESITLVTRRGQSIEYNLANIEKKNVEIQVLGSFGLQTVLTK